MVFCLKDIMAYLDENLKLTPQILTEMGTLPEEVTEKLERVSFIRQHFLWITHVPCGFTDLGLVLYYLKRIGGYISMLLR